MCYPRTLGEAESVRLGRWVGFRQEKGLIWDLSVAQFGINPGVVSFPFSGNMEHGMRNGI